MKFFTLASGLLAAVSGQFYHPYAHHVGGIIGLKSAPCVNAANIPVPCAAGYHYGKRSADADPQLLYAGVPFGSSTGLDPITQGLDPVTQGVALPYAHHYAGLHYYGKRSADGRSSVHGGFVYGKRSADAEADPQLLLAAGLPYAAHAVAPHGVAYTAAGLVHSSHVGVCVNYLGAQVPC